jgi:hypothetical protein
MDQIVSQITQRTGISEEQASQAVEIVANYLKGHLPAPVAGQIDGLLGGQGKQGGDQAPGGLGGLGNLFGSK